MNFAITNKASSQFSEDKAEAVPGTLNALIKRGDALGHKANILAGVAVDIKIALVGSAPMGESKGQDKTVPNGALERLDDVLSRLDGALSDVAASLEIVRTKVA